MAMTPKRAAARIRAELKARANPEDAEPMQRYMKSSIPFMGVKKPGRAEVMKRFRREWVPGTREDYEGLVSALWAGKTREERYCGISVARAYPSFVDLETMGLYERLIREGAWWDFVDEIAIQLVGTVWRAHRKSLSSRMDAWARDPDRWIRRAALIGQLKHRDETDHRRLFRYCRELSDDDDFFIRKGIGWSLREYGKSNPERVASFLRRHKGRLSPLSVREASRRLIAQGELAARELD